MSNNDTEFMPNQIERQIDLLARDQEGRVHAFSDARFISDLYQAHMENHAIVERVWRRLSLQVESTRALAAPGSEADVFLQPQERPQVMDITAINKRPSRLRKRFLETCAAVLIVAALLAGTLFVLNNASLAPTDTAPIATSSGLYVSTSEGVSRIDLASGKVFWIYRTSQQESVSSQVYVMDNVVVFLKHARSENLVGVDASTGRPLWSRTITQYSFIRTAGNGAIIVSTSYVFGMREIGDSTITAYQATTGQQLWSYQPTPPENLQALSSVNYRYILANGMLYFSSTPVTYQQPSFEATQIRAFQVSSGKSLWQKTIDTGNKNDWPWMVADGSNLYIVSGKEIDGMQRYEGIAFNGANGNTLWQKNLVNDSGTVGFISVSPTVAEGVLYIASPGYSLATSAYSPHIYAYNASNGTLLKHYTLGLGDGFNFPPLVVQNLVLYSRGVESQYPYYTHLVALDIQTGKPAWSVYKGPTSALEPQIVNDIIYAPGGNTLFAYTTSGKLLHSYQTQTTADASWDFTVVA